MGAISLTAVPAAGAGPGALAAGTAVSVRTRRAPNATGLDKSTSDFTRFIFKSKLCFSFQRVLFLGVWTVLCFQRAEVFTEWQFES